jgi:LytS/YehU family sensor histidine kinase
MSSTFEIQTSDVIKLILQFLKENHLLHTVRTLQDEAQVSLHHLAPDWGFSP